MADILEFSSLSIKGLWSLAMFLTLDCSVWSDCSEISPNCAKLHPFQNERGHCVLRNLQCIRNYVDRNFGSSPFKFYSFSITNHRSLNFS